MSRRQEFPLIRDFVRGYLHQDIQQEHSNATAAARSFVAALLPDERETLADQATRFSDQLRTMSIAEANQQFSEMGSAWIFSSASELQNVLHILQGEE